MEKVKPQKGRNRPSKKNTLKMPKGPGPPTYQLWKTPTPQSKELTNTKPAFGPPLTREVKETLPAPPIKTFLAHSNGINNLVSTLATHGVNIAHLLATHSFCHQCNNNTLRTQPL